MKKPDAILEIFLQPGEYYFGDESTRIRTLLGSCVSITLWHPRLRVGGMCHYMLPSRAGRPREGLDARYADEAMELLMREIRQAGAHPRDFEVKLFGGGNMFPSLRKEGRIDVSARNVEAARRWAKDNGMDVKAEHLGGVGHRNIIFDVWSGHVWLRQQPILADSHLNT